MILYIGTRKIVQIIINKQEYRSGHNEAVLKTVCLTARGFESLSLRQKESLHLQGLFFFYRLSRISAALVSGLTFGMIFSIRPFSSMIKVVRTTPKETFP